MMRYHPAVRHLADSDLSDIFRFGFEIGHDVTQWRADWRFSESYAAQEQGGGVLLDLCHEIDMAACVFPGLTLGGVDSLGHASFPGVDVATQIGLGQPGRTGTVAMDYLLPVSTRRIALRGTRRLYDFDLIAGQYAITGDRAAAPTFPFERNQMFLDLMRDFLALARGSAPSANPLLPRLDRVRESCDLIAGAWTARRFVGQVAKDIP
jgi:predicted dehydrogenase